MKKPPHPPRPKPRIVNPNAKTCHVTNEELEKLIVNHAASLLNMKPPFVHHISKDERLRVIVVVLEPVANVLEFKKS